jgi:hypothetical protein
VSDKIRNCFEDQGAAFYREVIHNGQLLARIRALRPLDRDALQTYLGRWHMENGAPVYDTTGVRPETLRLARIAMSLGGEIDGRSYRSGDEGWFITDDQNQIPPVTLENVNRLTPELLETLDQAVTSFENEYLLRRDALRKNLETRSGS